METSLSDYSILVDKRERALLGLEDKGMKGCDSRARSILITPSHLTTGDMIIMYKTKALVVIERKTLADLAASIKDGRKNNIDKLKSFREETGARIAYLIEGKYPSDNDNDKKYGGISWKALRSHLDHLIIRDEIFEIHTLDIIDTKRRLLELTRNLSSMSWGDDDRIDRNDMNLIRKVHIKSDFEIARKMWQGVPGVGIVMANMFLNEGITIYTVLRQIHNEHTLTDVLGSRKDFGTDIINNLTTNTQVAISILTAIPRISKRIATSILESYTLYDLTDADIEQDLATWYINDNEKVGKARAASLCKYMQFSIKIEGDV